MTFYLILLIMALAMIGAYPCGRILTQWGAGMENGVCKYHSGFEERLNDLENNKSALWEKWDKLNFWILITLGGVVVNILLTIFKVRANGQ